MKKEKGSILAATTLIAVVVLVLIIPLISYLSNENKSTTRVWKKVSALSLAEAGAEEAIWTLNYGDIETWEGSMNLWTRTLDLDGNLIDVNIAQPTPRLATVVSTGFVFYQGESDISKTVRIILGRKKVSPFNFAIFADEGILLDAGVIVDSFDSEGTINSDGDIGTNSIDFGMIDILSAEVNGDVFCGVGGETLDVIDNQGTINGELNALEEPFEFGTINLPEGLPSNGNYMGEAISESTEYVDFKLGAIDNIIINSDIELIITGDFYMEAGAEIKINPGGSLKIYVDGTFNMDRGSSITPHSQEAKDLFITTTENFAGTLNLDQDSEFWGTIYAPNANVYLDNDVGFNGSIIGKNIEIDQGTQIHYDESLKSLNFESDFTPYAVRSWQEIY